MKFTFGNKFLLATLAFVSMAVFLFTESKMALADIGPKPSMSFNFVYSTKQPLTIVSGEQFECKTNDCKDAKLLSNLGPQRFNCNEEVENGCFSMAYGYGPYHKIRIKFSDNQTRESNVFPTSEEIEANYLVRVTDYGLTVEKNNKTTSRIASGIAEKTNKSFDLIVFLGSLSLTLVLELFIALIYALIKKYPKKKLLLSVLGANLISFMVFYMIVYYAIPWLYIDSILTFIFLEILIVIFEAWFIFQFNKNSMSWLSVIILSSVMNIFTAVIGLFIAIRYY